ncbi:hypothetical protein chiPu_0029299 [Chiloscyllium punctatum]|uniref:Uncharacterized protein n=1 Tax=Chiloscyllium punctatum TaxID=137246 RepID=A0A401TRZ2_CHIPU|nr:hypothetical protein [Chiloscyllium punctatum]
MFLHSREQQSLETDGSLFSPDPTALQSDPDFVSRGEGEDDRHRCCLSLLCLQDTVDVIHPFLIDHEVHRCVQGVGLAQQ